MLFIGKPKVRSKIISNAREALQRRQVDADDYSLHIGVNRGSPGICERGTIGIWFQQSKVLTSGDLLTMIWEEVA